MSEFVEVTKPCRDCGQDFVLTVGEQEFFARMQYTNPTRCKPCRDKRKAEKGASAPQQQLNTTTPPRQVETIHRRRTFEPQLPPPAQDSRSRKRRSRQQHRDDDYGADW